MLLLHFEVPMVQSMIEKAFALKGLNRFLSLPHRSSEHIAHVARSFHTASTRNQVIIRILRFQGRIVITKISSVAYVSA